MQPEHHSLSRREVLWKMGAFAGAASFGGRSVPPSTPAPHAQSIDVRQLGAQGDGKADDTPAFEKAIEAARSAGLAVFVPRGIYRLTRTLVVENISLSGPLPGVWCADTDVLPILLPVQRDQPCLHLKAGGGVQALAIRYDWQSEPTSGPPAILVSGVGAYLSHVKILYPWDGVMADGVSNIGRFNMENVFIVAPRNIGVRVTGTWDAPTIRNVEVWNLGPVPRPLEKGVGFDLGKNDLIRLSDCFVFAMNIGYLLRDEIPGATIKGGTWGMLTGCSTDYCSIGIDVRGEHTLSVAGGSFWNHHQSLRVNGKKARVRVAGAEMKSNAAPCIEVMQSEHVVVSGCSILRPMTEYAFPAVHVKGGLTTMTGCHIHSVTEGLRVESGVRAALVSENTFETPAGKAVVNEAGDNVSVQVDRNLCMKVD
jgi:hypothetical protein